MSKVNIGVAAIGDVLDINCWSSTPYFFYQAGTKIGGFSEPWRLDLDYFKIYRLIWNLKQLILLKGKGGFQYSSYFLNKAEATIPSEYFSSQIISFNQVFPRATNVIKAGGTIYYYIDFTLYNLFNEASYNITLSEEVKQKAMALEKENYEKAKAIVTMGSWVQDTLITHYHLPKEKVHTILPGANITLPENYTPTIKNSAKNGSIKLGFVGKDWERKGLPVLIEIKKILESRGYSVTILVIGNCPAELINSGLVEYTGYINKQTDSEKFVKFISSCDIGCLFSSSEALGISTLEFLRVGVPVAGYYHQGLKDTLLEGASFRFNITDTPELIASAFEQYINDSARRYEMQKKACEYSTYVTWERCVNEWKNIIK
jgi:glycosyltransferase involved in cell wall biosynthesis